MPDIPAHLRWHLQQVRAEIHGPPPEDADQPSPEAPACPDTDDTDDTGDSSGDGDPSHRDTSDGPSTGGADTRPDTDPADVPDTDPADSRGAADVRGADVIPGITELRINYHDIIRPNSELERRLAALLAAQ